MKIKEKINKQNIIILSLPLLLLIVFEYPYYTLNKNIILSIVFIYSIYFMLLSISKSIKITTIFLAIIGYIIQIISIGKVQFIKDPLWPSDIFYTGDINEIINLIKDDIVHTLIILMPKLLILLIFTILIIIISSKYNIIINNTKNRIISFSTSIIVLLILLLPIKNINKFILQNFYNNDSYLKHVSVSSGDDYYKTYGHLAGMYGNILESRVYKPDNYNESLIKKEVKKAKIETDNTFGKPNIIVIFSESFWDIDKLDEIDFSKQITKNYNELKENGLSFQMLSPFYGGMSSNVEFEFLTGGTTNYYSSSYVPYMELYNNDKYYDAPSIITELKNNDYYTKMVAYYSDKLYNCGKVYNYMDVDETEFIEKVDKKNIKGQYVSDHYVVDKIIEEINNKDNKPLFYMTMTMQSHMPYLISKYNNYDIDIIKSDLDEISNNTIKSYAQGIYDADKELGRLYDYINTIEEPTIIVFYGDHLPYLEPMKYLNYFNTNDDKLNAYRKYNTESLIVANFDISSLKDENINYLGPDLLSAYILNHMDIEVSDYYKWLYSTRNIIGTSNRYVSLDQFGNIYFTSDLQGKKKDLYNIRKGIQYKYFHDIK